MSSLVYLGFSVILFVISYGVGFSLVAMVLGYFFSMDTLPMTVEWQAVYDNNVEVLQWLIPIVPAIGIFILLIKVIMVASVRGRD